MASPSKFSRRKFLVRGTFATACGLGAYAFGIEPRWISVERHELAVPNLPDRLIGATAVQLSDLHIGDRVNDSYLLAQFEYVRSLNPEFVFFTGDYLDNGTKWHLRKGIQLSEFFPRGSVGNAFVLGNHDFGNGHSQAQAYAKNTSELVRQLAATGLNVLQDQVVDLGGLKVAGLKDFWCGGFENESASEVIEEVSSGASIVLSHNPDTVDLPIWDGFESWILCGHTHGGQCTFPIIGAPICPVMNKRYLAGFYDIEGGHKLYISRGIGHTTRVRFMARPEITIFTLQKA
jgi:predicted MPP superfamily phosphohydrolase